jgi:hypothetical protein
VRSQRDASAQWLESMSPRRHAASLEHALERASGEARMGRRHDRRVGDGVARLGAERPEPRTARNRRRPPESRRRKTVKSRGLRSLTSPRSGSGRRGPDPSTSPVPGPWQRVSASPRLRHRSSRPSTRERSIRARSRPESRSSRSLRSTAPSRSTSSISRSRATSPTRPTRTSRSRVAKHVLALAVRRRRRGPSRTSRTTWL